VKQVGRELGVRYVLEGIVRKASDRVRITAQLIDAATGIHVWAERYDRESTDIFAIQGEIALSVVGAIEPTCFSPKPNVCDANGRVVVLPMTWSRELSPTSIPKCQSARLKR
jgi:hypothetical protein